MSHEKIIGTTKDGRPVFRNNDNSDLYKVLEKNTVEVETEVKRDGVDTIPEWTKTKKSKPKKLYIAKGPFYY